jgi:hypothetical protein
MNYKDAINASQILAARGVDADGTVVCSVAYYGEELVWLPGFGGKWAAKWAPVDEEGMKQIEALTFRPFEIRPENQMPVDIASAIAEAFEDEDEEMP